MPLPVVLCYHCDMSTKNSEILQAIREYADAYHMSENCPSDKYIRWCNDAYDEVLRLLERTTTLEVIDELGQD